MTHKFLLTLFFCLLFSHFSYGKESFNYDLHLTRKPGKQQGVVILAHGMGGNSQIADVIGMMVDKTVISFNFPDYDYGRRAIKPENTTFGTIHEILPLLYVIKKAVVQEGHQEIDLYGFSAGGGAIINALSILNSHRYDKELEKTGISQNDKETMLKAIQKGLIVLDVPLKSIQEIIDFRGSSPELEVFRRRYKDNDLEPIHSLRYLEGLSLNIIVHFQNPDEVLSNRDDELFIARLKKFNHQGNTEAVIGKDGGHTSPHRALWDFYSKLKNFQLQ